MGKKTVLAINFSDQRYSLLSSVCLLHRAALKRVYEEDKEKRVGDILGLSEEEIQAIAALGQETDEGEDAAIDEGGNLREPVKEEAIILCHFENSEARDFLDAIKASPVKYIPLKAMLTPNNIIWPIRIVLHELYGEYEYFRNFRNSRKK